MLPYDAAYISNIARLMKDDLGVRRVAATYCTGNLAFKIFVMSMKRTTTTRAGIRGDVPALMLHLSEIVGVNADFVNNPSICDPHIAS